MKTLVLQSLVPLVAACALASPLSAGFVYETPNEFTATGDFDGDGDDDLVIVDRSTGNYRLGYRAAGNAFTWAEPRASGIENVTGVSVGRLRAQPRDFLVVTAPDANRVNLLDPEAPDGIDQPSAVFGNGIGPQTVIAVDLGGNMALHDLFVATRFNPLPSEHRLSLLQNDGVAFTSLSDGILPGLARRGNRVLLKADGPEIPGVMVSGAAGDIFRTFQMNLGAAVPGPTVTGLSAGTDYLSGNFSGTAWRQFLFYKAGTVTLAVRPVQELQGILQFGAGGAFSFAEPIAQAVTLPGSGVDKLLMVFGGGETAGVYAFDGINAPVLVQGFAPPAGESFTGAIALGGHNLILLSASPGQTSSTRFHVHTFTGAAYVAGSSGDLPSVTALSSRANLFYFQNEPFVALTPNFLGSAHVGDWTKLFSLSTAHVGTEIFGSAEGGLGASAVASLGPLPTLTAFGLVNQMHGAISMFSFAAPLGEEVAEVVVSPPPGLYATSVSIKFSLSGPSQNLTVHYREGSSGNWLLYSAGTAIKLYKNTTLSYYAQSPGGAKKSPIRHAAYQFTQPPAQLDSDGDGVPDFVEIGAGLDPQSSGQDADGDGYSDHCEILSNTSPNDAGSHPVVCFADATPSDLIQGVLFQRAPGQVHPCRVGTSLRAFDLNGTMLASATASDLGIAGATDPAARLTVLTGLDAGLSAVVTEANFDLTIGGMADTKRLGRELISLVPRPRLPGGVTVPYVYGNGSPGQEMVAWINAAKQAYAAAASLKTIGDLEIHDTLIALLVEKKIREILLSRGYTGYDKITLFPFRPNDADRLNPPLNLLLSIEKQPLNDGPAFRLQTIFQTLSNVLSSPSPSPYSDLKAVVEDVYRISSLLSEDSPAGTYSSPVEAIRAFLHTGALPGSYLAQTSLSPGQIVNAYSSAGSLLASIPSRPQVDLQLKVRPDSFTGECTLLDPLVGSQPVSLWHREGVQYHLLEAFQLPPGSKIHVTGYTDIASLGCPGTPVEVIMIDLNLLSVPLASPSDADGDLVPDALELLLFGDLGQDGAGDDDNDSFSNLQEVLDGTDPKNSLSKGAAPADLSPPVVELEDLEAGTFKLTWYWPAAYADKFNFTILAAPDLSTPFTPTASLPVNLGNNQFEATLPNPGAGNQFYKVSISLK